MKARPRPNRRQGPLRARSNIEYHYDLGNDLFRLMLDETMTYSCAVFERDDEPLADSQRRKLRLVCDKLELGPDDHVLEIGCGWGSFAMTAASITAPASPASRSRQRRPSSHGTCPGGGSGRPRRASRGGLPVARGLVLEAGVDRDDRGDRRAVPVFFSACDRLLARGGRACVQTILIPDHRWNRYRRSPDWIERYVFPGCLIPSLEALQRAAAKGSRLTLSHVEEIGLHYAETLRRWRATFLARLPEVRALGYDEHFVRTWDFYLASCEAGFRTRALRDAQLVLER